MQITSYKNLTKHKIILQEPKEYKVKNSKLKYQRIKIETRYSNGKKGALVIETPFLFSFGVTERLNQETNQLTGYSIPICLWDKDSQPNESEKAFLAITKITQICQQYLEEEFGPNMASYLTINSLYWKPLLETD